jgi:hypothetical protein
MAYVFNPITGKLDDAGISTSTANTFTADQTFSGTANTAPNQTAASGSSIMTRDLGDARYSSITPIAFGFSFDNETLYPVSLPPFEYNFLPFNLTLFGSGLSSGNYVAPSTGYYFLTSSALLECTVAGNAGLFCFVNNVRFSDFTWIQITAGQEVASGTTMLYLQTGDVVSVAISHTCVTEEASGLVYYPIADVDVRTSFFNGFKL